MVEIINTIAIPNNMQVVSKVCNKQTSIGSNGHTSSPLESPEEEDMRQTLPILLGNESFLVFALCSLLTSVLDVAENGLIELITCFDESMSQL